MSGSQDLPMEIDNILSTVPMISIITTQTPSPIAKFPTTTTSTMSNTAVRSIASLCHLNSSIDLVGLPDLMTSSSYVQETIANYLNRVGEVLYSPLTFFLVRRTWGCWNPNRRSQTSRRRGTFWSLIFYSLVNDLM